MLGRDYNLSPKEAAELLGIHEETLQRWAREGKVACWTTPSGWRRFRREDLEALTAAGIRPPTDAAGAA